MNIIIKYHILILINPVFLENVDAIMNIPKLNSSKHLLLQYKRVLNKYNMIILTLLIIILYFLLKLPL